MLMCKRIASWVQQWLCEIVALSTEKLLRVNEFPWLAGAYCCSASIDSSSFRALSQMRHWLGRASSALLIGALPTAIPYGVAHRAASSCTARVRRDWVCVIMSLIILTCVLSVNEGAFVVIHLGRSKCRIEVLLLAYCTSVTGRTATTLIQGLLQESRSIFLCSRGF